MSDAGFRWSILVLLAIIACSLYVLSTVTVIGVSQRLVRRHEPDLSTVKEPAP